MRYIFVLVFVLASCSTNQPKELPKEVIIRNPSIRGTIEISSPVSNNIVIHSIFVKGVKEKDTNYDVASISITADTTIFRRSGEDYVPISVNDLQPGQRVIVFFTGPVAASSPPSATAQEIIVTE